MHFGYIIHFFVKKCQNWPKIGQIWYTYKLKSPLYSKTALGNTYFRPGSLRGGQNKAKMGHQQFGVFLKHMSVKKLGVIFLNPMKRKEMICAKAGKCSAVICPSKGRGRFGAMDPSQTQHLRCVGSRHCPPTLQESKFDSRSCHFRMTLTPNATYREKGNISISNNAANTARSC